MVISRWRAIQDLLVELGIWLALATFALYLTFGFDDPLKVYRFGAASWPRVIIFALFVCALAQCFFMARKRLHDDAMPERSGYWAQLREAGLGLNLKLLAMFTLPLFYLYLLPRTGYYFTTPFFLSGYMLLLGERRLRHLVGTSLLFYGLSLLVFTKLLFVPLPTGNWPGFYDFSNWLLILIR